MDEWRYLSDREGEKKERRRRGRWEYLIAGCTAIQEASNVSEKDISYLLSNGKPAGRQQEHSQASHTRTWLVQLLDDPTK